MNINTSPNQPNTGTQRTGDVIKGLLKSWAFVAVLAVILFLSAGPLEWGMNWVYLGLVTLSTLILSWLMPAELIEERSGLPAGAKKWDITLTLWMARGGPIVTMTLIGLDERYGWSPSLPPALQLGATLLLVAALALTDWAVLTNKFFSGLVRIQTERGHTVISDGPYNHMRHPGYAGAILYELATPVMLGSLWAMFSTALTVSVIILRTALEDRTLQRELDGYRAYTRQVRYRLFPGLW